MRCGWPWPSTLDSMNQITSPSTTSTKSFPRCCIHTSLAQEQKKILSAAILKCFASPYFNLILTITERVLLSTTEQTEFINSWISIITPTAYVVDRGRLISMKISMTFLLLTLQENDICSVIFSQASEDSFSDKFCYVLLTDRPTDRCFNERRNKQSSRVVVNWTGCCFQCVFSVR